MEKLTLEQLDKLSTKRLYKLFQSVRLQYFTYPNSWDFSQKQLDEIEEYYNLLKLLLSEREHMPRKK